MRPVSGFTDLALSPPHLAPADLGAPSQRPARRRPAPDPCLRAFGSLSEKLEFRAACHPMCSMCAICWGARDGTDGTHWKSRCPENRTNEGAGPVARSGSPVGPRRDAQHAWLAAATRALKTRPSFAQA